jgi:hypothetical protein
LAIRNTRDIPLVPLGLRLSTTPRLIKTGQPTTIMNLRVAIIATALISVLVGNSPAQNVHAIDRGTKNAMDRDASTEMNLKNVQNGISERTEIIQRKKREVSNKRLQIEKYLEASKGDLFAERIARLDEEIREANSVVEKAHTELNELIRARDRYESEQAKAHKDLVKSLKQ